METSEVRKFRENLRRFERLVVAQMKGSSCCSGVTLAQCHALLEIEVRQSLSLGELAEALGLDKSTLSRTVDGLVNIGLVKRDLHPQDRRSVQLSLTSQGQQTCDRINNDNDEIFIRVLDRIELRNRRDILGGFQELVAAMAAEMDSGCAVCAPLAEMGGTDS
jgi:DNA-binding MarR family transcriptional regulator